MRTIQKNVYIVGMNSDYATSIPTSLKHITRMRLEQSKRILILWFPAKVSCLDILAPSIVVNFALPPDKSDQWSGIIDGYL